MKHGQILVISGASGAGKGTVCRALMERFPDMHLSISATTRAPRPSEVDGVHYHFLAKPRFEEMIARNQLLEYNRYVDNYYGTPAQPVDEALAEGRDALLEIDVNGALKVKENRPEAILIFLVPPSLAELERRLRARGDTALELIARRLETARAEYELAHQYDYIVVNSTVENACDEISAILKAHTCKTKYRTYYLEEEK